MVSSKLTWSYHLLISARAVVFTLSNQMCVLVDILWQPITFVRYKVQYGPNRGCWNRSCVFTSRPVFHKYLARTTHVETNRDLSLFGMLERLALSLMPMTSIVLAFPNNLQDPRRLLDLIVPSQRPLQHKMSDPVLDDILQLLSASAHINEDSSGNPVADFNYQMEMESSLEFNMDTSGMLTGGSQRMYLYFSYALFS